MFSIPSLGLTLGRLMDLMEFLLLFSKLCLRADTLVKLFHLCLWTSTFPSCCKYACIQPVAKKGDRSNSSNYRPVALLSCLSKAFETILKQWFLKYMSTFNLLSDRQYGFRKERSAGDLLAFRTDSWSSSLSRFGETFAVTLDISEAFDIVWHKSLLSKLPSYGFYPSLCFFISSFLSDRSISAVVDGNCSKHTPINSGVPQSSFLSPTQLSSMIFPLLIALSPLVLMTPLCTIPSLLKVAPNRLSYIMLG